MYWADAEYYFSLPNICLISIYIIDETRRKLPLFHDGTPRKNKLETVFKKGLGQNFAEILQNLQTLSYSTFSAFPHFKSFKKLLIVVLVCKQNLKAKSIMLVVYF